VCFHRGKIGCKSVRGCRLKERLSGVKQLVRRTGNSSPGRGGVTEGTMGVKVGGGEDSNPEVRRSGGQGGERRPQSGSISSIAAFRARGCDYASGFSSRTACQSAARMQLPGSRSHFTYAHSQARRRAWRLGTNGHRPGGCGLCTEMKRAGRRPYHLIGNATTTSTLMQAAPRRDWVTPIANRPADLRGINPGLILQ
jgi:hypothetical protein